MLLMGEVKCSRIFLFYFSFSLVKLGAVSGSMKIPDPTCPGASCYNPCCWDGLDL